jgi:branched-chain amino acid transport system permease protein
MQRVVRSPFGRVMIAIRESEERAEAVGYNTFWYKMGAFGISGFFAAVAGALFAGYRRSVAPENTFDLFVTADALLAAIIGGFGTLAGSLYGHLFVEFLGGILTTESHGLARFLREHLPEGVQSAGAGGFTVLEFVNVFVDGRAELYLGLVFIAFVLFVPRGILGTLRDRLGGTVAEKLPERLDRYRR